MNWKSLTTCIGMVVLANAASAQVYRCKDASGNTTYAGSPCTGAHTGTQIQRAQTREEMLEERLRIAEENERKANIRAQTAERASINRESESRTLNINYQNNTPDKSKSIECMNAKKELEYVSSIQTLSRDAKRARMSAADSNFWVSCR